MTDNKNDGPNNKNHQDPIVCSYGYKLICVDEQYSRPYKTYSGENTTNRFINEMNESEYCCGVIEREFNKPYVMNKKNHKDFKKSTNCWICQKQYKDDNVKVKDHYHITGKY